MTDMLGEIRARAAAKGDSAAGVTMTQPGAERRTLLRLLDGTREELAAALGERARSDPSNLPTHTWGEVVTWERGRILVPLCLGDETVADLELDRDGAEILAAMLADVAAPAGPREVGP